VVASLGALGSVIVASSCCLPLLLFLFAAGADRHVGLWGQAAALPAGRFGVAYCVCFLQILARQTMQLQAQQD